jgi:hypothetical protein
MERILSTLVVASIGGLVGIKLKMPAGAMVGAMVAVGLANIIGFRSTMPPYFRTAAQIVVGGMVGLSITRDTVMGMKTVAGPAAILVVSMIGFGLMAGWIIAKVTGMDMVTAFFSSTPGGMMEMTLMAEASGGEGAKVALMQLARFIGIVLILPPIIKWVLGIQA